MHQRANLPRRTAAANQFHHGSTYRPTRLGVRNDTLTHVDQSAATLGRRLLRDCENGLVDQISLEWKELSDREQHTYAGSVVQKHTV